MADTFEEETTVEDMQGSSIDHGNRKRILELEEENNFLISKQSRLDLLGQKQSRLDQDRIELEEEKARIQQTEHDKVRKRDELEEETFAFFEGRTVDQTLVIFLVDTNICYKPL